MESQFGDYFVKKNEKYLHFLISSCPIYVKNNWPIYIQCDLSLL